ncbi:MAG TPA: hypothetical protein VGH73_22150 [Thermoanaerobaculia bacterium]
MPGLLPEFGEGFDSKAREPQFAVLFLLASAFREVQEDLLSATSDLRPGLVDYTSALASAFADAIYMQTEPVDALLTWDSFTARQRARKAPQKVQELLANGRETIQAALHAGFDPRRYLADANQRARAAIGTLATRIGLAGQTTVELAPIRISWKESRDFLWPSTGGRKIAWVFQYKHAALWAAVLAEIILQHEYLSHVLPRSDSLSETVREGWLMETLHVEVRERGSPADLRTFMHVRDSLNGLPRSEPLAWVTDMMLLVREDLYWSLTRDLLAEPPGYQPEGRGDVVLRFLEGLTRPGQRREFLENPRLAGLDSLYEEVRMRAP